MTVHLAKVLASDRLPTVPQVALKVIELVNCDQPDLHKIAETIKSDPAICAKIIRTVNSSLFGLRKNVGSIEQALPILGCSMVRTLMLSFSLTATRSPSPQLAAGYQRVWRSSLIQAVVAETLALGNSKIDDATCFVVGLLQDIGVLSLLHTAPREYLESVLVHQAPPLELERDVFGFTHVDVGIEMVRRWRLEQSVVDAIAHHHDELNLSNKDPSGSQSMTEIAIAAARIEEWITYDSWNASAAQEQRLVRMLRHFGMESESIALFVNEIRLRVNEISILFGVDVGEWSDQRQLVMEAKELLDGIALENAFASFQTNKKLAQANQELEQKCAAEAELQSAKEAAETASGQKSEFLTNMSHEIRTPLTAILGYAEILMNEVDSENAPPHWHQAIDAIWRNGEHLLGIINNLLDLSKIEAGKLIVESIECSPFQLLSDVVTLMRIRAEEKQLTLDLVNAGPVPETIHTDPTRLKQILINLVANAVKFTDIGGVRLEVEMADDHQSLHFRVTDTGVGINHQQIEELLQPFTQGDASTTRKYGGTGLGLALCKRLSALLGGTISVSSEEDVGSTFTVTVATGNLDGVRLLNHPREFAMEKTNLSKITSQPFSDPLNGCRVLLAEDALDVCRLISFFLSDVGADVSTAENGQAACEMIIAAQEASTPFDVILMDMQMPLLDGYGAARRLRAAGCSLPIIALTAHAFSDARRQCLDAGCDDYLSKPINRNLLLALVSRYWRESANVEAS